MKTKIGVFKEKRGNNMSDSDDIITNGL